MKTIYLRIAKALLIAVLATGANAGTIFYAPVQATNSDNSCGISTDNQYTSAVDAGNTHGNDRVLNGITLYSLTADGESATADNCTLSALSGSLANGAGSAANIRADGVFKDVLSDTTFNNGATDNSQQEIVLDADSLEAGATYDLRVYICNSSGQDRQVNLAFAGDGQSAVETGWFNEDDARTSAGGFKDQNQVYYINYRFTWDGDSTPGVTISQKSGNAPFCLYALTNQIVPGGGANTGAAGGEHAEGGAEEGQADAGDAGDAGDGGDTGLVTSDSDEVGVSSDDFYGDDSLNSNGRWVDIERWGRSWQPTNVPQGWCPYTNGNWRECDDCGWTFVSDEPWAWCTYHYGRWCKVSTGCGWAWVPGKVWAASWVSWRRGRDEHGCDCVGWAPLPPEAGCEFDVGISSWVDERCDIGPDYYTFVNIRDFGSDSYLGCGCIWERERNSTIIIDTFNVTNICHTRWGTYCGGPDYNWCNTRIRSLGGKEVSKIHVNRYDDPGKMGGKHAKLEGDRLSLVSPRVRGEKNPQHAPKVAEHIGRDKIDKGWSSVKDKNLQSRLRNHLAEETKGKNAKTAKATLPGDVAARMKGRHVAGGGQHPGQRNKMQTAGGNAGNHAGGFNQHPGAKGQDRHQAQGGARAGGAKANAGFDQHPGGKRKGATAGANTKVLAKQKPTAMGGGAAGGGAGHPAHRRPGESLGRKNNQQNQAQAQTGGGAATNDSGRQNRRHNQGAQQPGGNSAVQQNNTTSPAGPKSKHGRHQQQQAQQGNNAQGGSQGNDQSQSNAGGGAGGQHRRQHQQQMEAQQHQQQQQQQMQAQQHQQQQQQQMQARQQMQAQQRQQRMQARQQQQQNGGQQQQQRQGGGRRRGHPTPTPH